MPKSPRRTMTTRAMLAKRPKTTNDDNFVSLWKIPYNNTTVTLTFEGKVDIKYKVDWGDGSSVETFHSKRFVTECEHTYTTKHEYVTIVVSAQYEYNISFSSVPLVSDRTSRQVVSPQLNSNIASYWRVLVIWSHR